MSDSGKFIERRSGPRVRFSIGAKLITIISIIVLVSLGSITALVSWLVREDLTITAEENNFEVNRRAAAETEQTLEKMRLLSLSFSRTAAFARRADVIQGEADYFFSQNPQIAALFYTSNYPAAWTNRVFVNERFFLSHGGEGKIDAKLANDLRVNSVKTQENAALGQTVLINASPLFDMQGSTYLAAMFFPIQVGSCCVLFSTENLNESFGMGVNASFLINADGDIIADADLERVKTQVNLSEQEIIRQIFNSPDRNKQMLVALDVQPTQKDKASSLFSLL